MRALRFSRPGHPLEVLELVELPEPKPGPGQALVEVLASPISPTDRLGLRGLYPLPFADNIPGVQGVARVLELGPDCGGPPVGSMIILPVRCGAWRERLCVPVAELVVIPPGRDPAESSTLRIEALTAAVLLDDLASGDWFIHSPGAGAVGRYLTALGGLRDMHSIALVGSREPIADLWGLGADHVLVREPSLPNRLAELGLPSPRMAFDGSGGVASELLATCMAPTGELIVYGAVSRMPVQLSVAQLVFRDIQVRGFWLYRWARAAGPEYVQASLQELVTLNLRERVEARVSLDDWRDGLHLSEQPGIRGRVVLTP